MGPPGQNMNQYPGPGFRGLPPPQTGSAAKDVKAPEQKQPESQPKAPEAAPAPKAAAASSPGEAKKAPTPPIESKPDVAAAVAPPAPQSKAGPKGRVPPAIPLASPRNKPSPATSSAPAQPTAAQAAASTAQTYQNATQAATAAVAAAMAKLPGAGRQQAPHAKADASDGVDNLTRKVNEMRTDDGNRQSRGPGTGGHVTGHRGGGRGRGGRRDQPAAKPVDVPTTDFDFETSNAKFNKQDLVKEAIATGSPEANGLPFDGPAANGSTANGENKDKEKGTEETAIPPAVTYDKKSSFFDNISSESRDREERDRLAGQEFRTEERKKNMETFGQGSVDNNYRGGYRGRGRGRGGFRGGRGNFNNTGGFTGRGRGGGFRGGRGGAAPHAGTEAS
jgi:protein LSM14